MCPPALSPEPRTAIGRPGMGGWGAQEVRNAAEGLLTRVLPTLQPKEKLEIRGTQHDSLRQSPECTRDCRI
jgi:hypothetical protein